MVPIRSNAAAPMFAPPAPVADAGVRFIQQGIDQWCERLPANERAALAAQWTALHRSEAAELAADDRGHETTGARAIFDLLHRVSQTGGAGGVSEAQRDTAVALLQAMANDGTFRDACCAQARLASANCHDNALVQFEALRLQLPFQHAQKAEDFVHAARDKAATDLLQDFVAKTYPDASEALEIFQYLKVRLASRLGLPESRMEYARFAERYLAGNADRVVRLALEHVDGRLDQQIAKTLLDVPLWEAHLKLHYRDALDAYLITVHDRLADAMESDRPAQGVLRRIDGLNNIFLNKEALALERLTQLCVEESRRPDPRGTGIRARVEGRLSGPEHRRHVTELVQARLDGDDAAMHAISAAAAAEANQWSQPTSVLAAQQWGRRAGSAGDADSADPIGAHARQQQRAAQPAVPVPRPDGMTQRLVDQEEMDLQRALAESLRIAQAPARVERSMASDVRAALESLRGDRRTTTGVDQADLAWSELRRLSGAGAADIPNPPYMVDAGRLLQCLERPGVTGGDARQVALGLHGEAALLDLMRSRLKGGQLDAEVLFHTLFRHEVAGRSAMQRIATRFDVPARSQALEIAQAHLATSTAFLLRRLMTSLPGDGVARIRAALTLPDGSALFRDVAQARGGDTPRQMLQRMLQEFDLDVRAPRQSRERLEQVHREVLGAISGIRDAALREAYRPAADLQASAVRLSQAILAAAR